MSKQEIAQELNLSMPTVTQNLKELETLNLIEYNGSYQSTGGRKAKKVSFVFDARISIGIELSHDYIRFIAIDLYARVIFKEKMSIEFDNIELYKKKIKSGFKRFIINNSIDYSKVLGVGIAIPGTFVHAGNVTIIEQSPSLKFKSVVAQDLFSGIPFDCSFNNDADAAGFAELWYNKQPRSFIYISIKNGVGGAILLNNKPYYGTNHRAGEIGHMTLVKDGELCACGMKGCFEAYVGQKKLTEKHDCELSVFFRNVDEGIKEYVDTFNEYMDYLAIGINNIRMLFDCDIVIGGEINEYLEKHLDKLKNILEKKNTFYDNADYVKFAHFKSDAAAIGVALVHVEAYLESI